jgi:hypothetical protein
VLPRKDEKPNDINGYIVKSDRLLEQQIEFETELVATGLFEGDALEPKWSEVKAALGSPSTQ